MKKKHLCIFLLSASLLTLVGCSGGDGDSGSKSQSVAVCVYDGGYGTSWIEKIAKEYEEDTGIKVEWTADDSILDRIEDQLKNGCDYDIIMSHDINWQNFASQGLLASLDDLYERNVEGRNKKFKDSLVSGALEMSKCEGEGEDEEHFYKVCYTQGAGGLIYNVDMFKEHKWTVPTTYSELVTLCEQIYQEGKASGRDEKSIVPLAWSGIDRQYYWDYLVFEWWAELAGQDKINAFRDFKDPSTGKYSTGYEVYNPSTHYKEFIQAYEMWYNLIVAHPEYSIKDAYSTNLASAKSAFVNGEVAMIPYAQWGKYELQQVTDNNSLDFNIAMMKTPKANASSNSVNYMVGFGDSMIIPENALNVDGAKDFLLYLASAKACKTFVKESQGAFLAFDYSDVDLEELQEDTYTKSIYDKLTTSTDFTLASKSPLAVWTSNSVMPWVTNEYYYASACKEPSKYTSSIVGTNIYNIAKENWVVWCRSANVK